MKCSSALLLGTLALAGLGSTVVRAQAVALDAQETQINVFTTGDQWPTGGVALPGGNFVVVWNSPGSFGHDSSGYSVQARLIDSGGHPIGPGEFQVNSYTTGNQSSASVAADPKGNFVIVWNSQGSFGSDSDSWSVQARRYRSDGTTLDPVEFQVNTYTTDYQGAPAIASLPGGGFVVAWASSGSWGTDNSYKSIQTRRFDANGNPLDPVEFQVNSYTFYDQLAPRVASDAAGDFVVVWQSYGSLGNDQSARSIQARRFAADGKALDPTEFQVNAYTFGDQRAPNVLMAASGEFVVGWTSDFSPGTDHHIGVLARRFGADGTPLDPVEFQANVYTNTAQIGSSLLLNGEGDFVVAWTTVASAGIDQDDSPQARRFRRDGTAVDSLEFPLNTYTTSWQFGPLIAGTPDGDFIATWPSYGSYGNDTSASSVQIRRFGRPTLEVTSTSGGTGGPDCTLRDAISAANTGAPVGGCPAGNEGAVIALPAEATISLTEADNGTNALPRIVRPVSIAGKGARIERNPMNACTGASDLRLFEVADGGVLTLSDVTVANGCLFAGDGGAVLADGGTLVLNRAQLKWNKAAGTGGGIAARNGNLLIRDSFFEGNVADGPGGGLVVGDMGGFARVSGSTFVGNGASQGGGLALTGTVALSLVNSTVVDNVASVSGGGLDVGWGTSRLTVDFATVAGNSAPVGAALHVDRGGLAVSNSLFGESQIGTDCAAGSGALTATGLNLDTDGSCAALTGGSVATVTSLGLGPLAWSGAATWTRPPLIGSPALDAAPACATATGSVILHDERGHIRPTDDDGDFIPECDLGAVELGYLFADGFETSDTGNWSLTVP